MIRVSDDALMRKYCVDVCDTLLVRRKVYSKLLRRWAWFYWRRGNRELLRSVRDNRFVGHRFRQRRRFSVVNVVIGEERRRTFFGMQFVMKQMLRFYYKMSERRFRNVVWKSRLHMQRNIYLIGLLELRLYVILVRALFFFRFSDARLFVKRFGVYVNDKIVYNPEFRLSVGDVISIDFRLWMWLCFMSSKTLLSFYCFDKTWFWRSRMGSKCYSNFYVPLFLEVNYVLATCVIVHWPRVSDVVFPFHCRLDEIQWLYK